MSPYEPEITETSLLPRSALIDLGSNSTRMVIFEGVSRNPLTIFNEKAVLKLGKGLTQTGKLNAQGMKLALDVVRRFNTIARAMGATPYEVMATAAVRDATNGADFIAGLQNHLPGVPIRIISGEEEAEYSATGVLCSIPDAFGTVADIGGGSLELIRVKEGKVEGAKTLKLGVIRLSDRAEGNLVKARKIVEDDLKTVSWLSVGKGKALYLVGGAFRALAQLYMHHTKYPLNIIHYYTLSPAKAQEMVTWFLSGPTKEIQNYSADLLKRLEDIPYAAIVLKRLMQEVQPSEIIFSTEGLREGWYMQKVAFSVAAEEPRQQMAYEMCKKFGRSMQLPRILAKWTDFLRPYEKPSQTALRELACWFSDIGALDHPAYRAEEGYRRLLLLPSMSFNHYERVYLAMVVAMRYGADLNAPFMQPTRKLLGEEDIMRAQALGLSLRLAYTICGGTPDLLEGTGIAIEGKKLTLQHLPSRVAVMGESVKRRMSRLAQALNLKVKIAETGEECGG
ncbi:Ppx/GppA family phosphatase [Entomobacter blattae]|uniref:Guanosine-5'-triphosphate,3'-diphosphate pyrophosphatase n=1 Tax=Entomobacter blattae TaxID=2762277 RepID=A0A7H1NS02_9PROT|nr:Ppx/GppA family phosphatase [Entomobacter blattae]QNT78562.1 Guanosine-5'-triphosphate,3'-diphosphate pyrophosphatase [Entomobacter blattae]